MRLRRPVWHAAAIDGTHRSLFQHIFIERDGPTSGRAIAADGYIAAVVPVTLLEDDIAGLVDRHVFIDHEDEAYGTIRLTKDKAIGRYWEEPRHKEGLDSFAYPDLANVLSLCSETESCPITVDTQLLSKVSKAIGTTNVHLITFGLAKPIIVAPIGGSDGAFGLIMPMKVNASWATTHYEQFMAWSKGIADYAHMDPAPVGRR